MLQSPSQDSPAFESVPTIPDPIPNIPESNPDIPAHTRSGRRVRFPERLAEYIP